MKILVKEDRYERLIACTIQYVNSLLGLIVDLIWRYSYKGDRYERLFTSTVQYVNGLLCLFGDLN